MKTTIDWSHLQPKYSGQWVAFKQDETSIVSFAANFNTAIKKAIKQGVTNPIMFKVPKTPVAYVGAS